MNLMLECADISHPVKPLRIHTRWALLVTEEFFAQGEGEAAAGLPVGNLMSRQKMKGSAWAKSLVGFITFAVSPKWNALLSCTTYEGWYRKEGWYRTIHDNLHENLDRWKNESERYDSSYEATRKATCEADGTFAAALKRRPIPWGPSSTPPST